jgi:hypothetical protein
MSILGVVGRLVFWVGCLLIVGKYVWLQFMYGDLAMALVGLIFFPITFFLSPWFTGLWWLLLLSLVGYWLSTFTGLPPVD